MKGADEGQEGRDELGWSGLHRRKEGTEEKGVHTLVEVLDRRESIRHVG